MCRVARTTIKMKAACSLVLLFVLCYHVECRKTYAPIDKNANLAFINMEGGSAGGARPSGNANPPPNPGQAPAGAKPTPVPVQPVTTKIPASPPALPAQPAQPAKPAPPAKPAVPVKPTPTAQPAQPAPTAKPAQPASINPKPVNPPPAAQPITTPGPGSVKQLINFYDSQGKASQIRPYSYSQAVKQG